MADFDQAARYLIRREPGGFFAWLSAPFAAAWQFRRWLDTSALAFPGEPDRVCDTVAEFAAADDPDRRCLLDVEAQTRPHPDMLERSGEYAYRLRREMRHGTGRRGKYPVLSVVLNLTGPVQPHVLDMTEATLGGSGIRARVVQRTLREEDAAGTLRRIAAGDLRGCVLPWVVLMRGAGQPGIIEEWKRLAAGEPDPDFRSDYGIVTGVFAQLTRHRAAWRQALEGWNMERSRVVMEWERKGEVRGQRQFVLEALEEKFGSPVPDDIQVAVADIKSSAKLSNWHRAALRSDSLDAFRAAVGPLPRRRRP